MDSEILNQLTTLEKNVDSEVTKPKKGRKKKADIKINELEDNDIRDKRERLVTCVLSGNSKPLPPKPVISDFYVLSEDHLNHELAFITLSMIGIGAFLWYSDQ